MIATVRRPLILGTLTAILVAAGADRVSACSCGGSPTFDDEARRASIVLFGRVTSIDEERRDDDPRSIVVDVEGTLKGATQSSVVVVWNEAAGSSCGGLFAQLAVDSSIALAVMRVSDVERPNEMWELMEFHPPGGDLLVRIGCGQPLKVFASAAERERWLRLRGAQVGVSPAAAWRGSPGAASPRAGR